VAALDKEYFWRGIERLQQETGFDAQMLDTFMCNSVGAAIDKEYFWPGIELLQQEIGFDAQMFVTFMCDSVAAAIDKEYFWRGIERLQQEMGFDAQMLVTFMCGSVARRLDKEYFWNGIEMLSRMRFRNISRFSTGKDRFTCAKLNSILCTSFMNLLEPLRAEYDLDIWQFINFVAKTAAFIDKDGFMGIVRQWKKRVGTESMMKLFSFSGLAGRIIYCELEARLKLLWENMRKSGKALVSFLNKKENRGSGLDAIL
jgi:hypothetical protein